MDDLNPWISDKLISLLGFSKTVVVQFVISLSHNASCPDEIVKQLVDLGASLSDETSVFANEIFARVERKRTPAPNLYQQREREAAVLARKQKEYTILGEDDVDADNGSISKIRIKNFRKRVVQSEVDDEIGTNRGEGRQVRKRITDDVDDGSESEEERVRDQIEKEELECRIRDRDAERTRRITDQKSKKKKEIQGVRRSYSSIETLRKLSRQEYLKKREQKKLDELRDDINDEEYLFEGVELSKKEYDELRHKKEVYKLVEKRAEVFDHTDDYRIPEAYDQAGCVNQEKRFAVALQGYKDAAIEGKTNGVSEQQAWEEHQINKAIFMFGSKDKIGGKYDDFEFVFNDLKSAAAVDYSNFEKSVEEELSEESAVKQAVKKIQNERETLPIYSYKDELLQDINDHQVVVIVGETGCGKTTQLSQYLHEAGYSE